MLQRVVAGDGGTIEPMARYYRLDEANERLAELRPLLQHLREDRNAVAELQQQIRDIRSNNGSADHAAEIGRLEDQMRHIVGRMKDAVDQVDEWGIALRDIGTGLIDFPALASGRPIWLCWRLGEEGGINWWHETDQGFDSRRRLSELS
jgi:hypothetical protein